MFIITVRKYKNFNKRHYISSTNVVMDRGASLVLPSAVPILLRLSDEMSDVRYIVHRRALPSLVERLKSRCRSP